MKRLTCFIAWAVAAFKTLWDAAAFPCGLPTFYDAERVPKLEKQLYEITLHKERLCKECSELAIEVETTRKEIFKLNDKLEDLSDRLAKCHADNEALHHRYKSMFS